MASQPERVDRYEIKSPIGGGGMGTLYLAQDPNTGRLVALKLLRASFDSSELRTRFRREAQALAALNHQNVVTIYDSGEYRGSPFMVMEYVRGETIAEKLARRAQIPLTQKLKWLTELCSGLAHVHESGVIHRDIKPANLMVDRQDRLKIVDFGIARVAESLSRSDVQVTQMHVQIGTPGYMAPEQMRGTGIDHRCDLFAVGAVAYELLSGREAFEGRTSIEVQQKVLRGQATPLGTVVPTLPPGIADAVHRALQPDPTARFQDAATLGMVFDRERASLGPGAVSAAAPPLPGPTTARGTGADEAFRKAIEALDAGASGAARRHALEALAEAPDHPGARTVLTEIDARRAAPNPRPVSPPAPRTVPASAPPPAEHREPAATTAVEKTVIMQRPEFLRPPAPAPRDEPKTVVVPARPASRPSTAVFPPPVPGPSAPAPISSPPASAGPHDATVIIRRPVEPRASPSPPPARPRPRRDWMGELHALLPGPLTGRQRAVVASAAALLIASVVGLVIWEPWATRHDVRIRPAEGGTVRGPGLECGAGANDCTASFRAGEALSLEVRPDPGYVLHEYTGDCAPMGQLIVRGPAECGATFERTGLNITVPGTQMLLTIVPPDKAQVVGQNISCGSGQKQCDAQFAPGTVIQLQASGLPGVIVRGFTGDCDSTGRVVMDGPKTCAVVIVGEQPIVAGAAGEDRRPPVSTVSEPRPPGKAGPTDGKPPGPSTAPSQAPNSSNNSVPAGPPGTPPGDGPSSSAGDRQLDSAETKKGPDHIVQFEERARDAIKDLLPRYLDAYNKLSYSALKTVYVNAPDDIRKRLEGYRSMEYVFDGDPKYLVLDADEKSGAATIELKYKQTVDLRVGKPQKVEGTVVLQAYRGANGDWVISGEKMTPKRQP